jgi:release factor glutamine methyltransferase
VALAIADELPDAQVTATDTSTEALELARENAEANGLAGRVDLRPGSVPDREFDLAVANLPYVAEPEWRDLAPEITRFEPPGALLAGPDGLDAFREVIPAVRAPVLALEIGAAQAVAVRELMEGAGFERTEVRRDLAGHDRVILGRR